MHFPFGFRIHIRQFNVKNKFTKNFEIVTKLKSKLNDSLFDASFLTFEILLKIFGMIPILNFITQFETFYKKLF